ncbi:MAG TPA: YfhO family protein [Thermoanaerobaculia bacterium]|jgi:hypothetical protein
MNLTWLYVGAMYAAAVLLARRAGIDLPKRVALFFYALVLLFFWLPLTAPYVNFQTDVLTTLPPWRDVTRDHHQYTPQLNDLALQIVPWAHQVRESWKALEPPLWNHLSGSGYPLLGNAQSSALSLLRLVTLPLSLGHAVTAEGAFKVLIALTFAFLLCRRRYSLVASATGAVTFGFSGFMVGWLHFPMATAACLAPVVLYCVELLVENRTYGRFVFAAAMWAQLLFAGHPETAAHLFWLAAVYLLWLLFVERVTSERKPLVFTLGGVMIVAALLASPYLVPVLETVPQSKRIAELKATPMQAGRLPYSDWSAAVVMLQPHFFGQGPYELYWRRGAGDVDAMAGFAGVLGVVAWLACASLVIARRAWRSREMLYVLLTLFILGVLFNAPGAGELFHWTLPIAAHGRVRLIFVLLAALQAAAAIDRARGVSMLIAIAATAGVHLWLLYAVPFAHVYRFDSAALGMFPALFVFAAATLVAIARGKMALHGATLLLLVAVIAELFAFGRARPTPLHERTLFPVTPLIAKLQQLAREQPPHAPFRVTGMQAQLFPNTNAIFGFEDIRAHDPMSHSRYLGFLKLTAGYTAGEYFGQFYKPATVFDYLNVKYITLDRNLPPLEAPRYALLYDGIDGRIYENREVLPRFYAVRNVILEFRRDLFYRNLRDHEGWRHTAFLDELKLESKQMGDDFLQPRPENSPLAQARIVEAKPTDYRIHVDAPRWSLVVSSVPWWPGWRVERNGFEVKPIRVNALFVGFAVPPGTSEVRVWFAPRSFWWSAYAALATIAALIAWPFVRRRMAAR